MNARLGSVGLVVAGVLVAWALCAWCVLRPAEIASDWHSWRQTDTQTIALNFTRPGASILSPQINWGGDGPGYVETELQLYTRTISLLMPVFGEGEWIGQLLSLLAITAAGAVVFVHLSHNYEPVAALVGLGAFLAARTSSSLATVVMPDAFALLGYVAAWTFFSQFAQRGRTRDVVFYGITGTLAMLIKPTTAHLGISSFLLLLLSQRVRLRDYRVWLTWLAMVAVFGLYLVHAHRLYTAYGNTFGLLVGEDSKTPRLRYLIMPQLYLKAAHFGVTWAVGLVAALALVVQALRRRLGAEHLALAVGNSAIVLVALRYTSDGAGIHYFAPASLLAASGMSNLASDLLRVKHPHAALAIVGALLLGEGYRSVKIRHFNANFFGGDASAASVLATGREVDRLTDPNDLIVVRSQHSAYDTFWQQPANYHDPRIFYLSRTRGWTLGREQKDVTFVADAVGRGARFFADPVVERSAVLDRWLATHGELVWSHGSDARIWKLHAAPAAREGTR